jgi:hypothetical protein
MGGPRGHRETELPPEYGVLEEPVFVRGFDPAKHFWIPPPPRSPWNRHFELGRQHPGQWMLVAKIDKGGCKDRARRIESDRMRILNYLQRYLHLENWEVRRVTVSGTWCDRELYMRYLGEWTEEEYQLEMKRRRERYEAKQGLIAANKARRAQEARDKAREDEAAAQVRIRGRRRPGG